MNETTSYLLDTDIMIYWLRNKYPAINQKVMRINPDRILISSITVAELYYGAYNSQQREQNIRLIDDLLSNTNVVYFDENAAVTFGKIKAALKKQGKIVCDSDLFIAATAVANNLVMVTNNEKHFKRIDTLKVENRTQ